MVDDLLTRFSKWRVEMGVDLTLHVLHDASADFAQAAICLDRCRELWDWLEQKLKLVPLQGRFFGHTDDGWKEITTDPYGKPLTVSSSFSMGSAITGFYDRVGVSQPSPFNWQVGNFLRAIPETRVILYWH
jgi:hypothetical protein